MSLRLKAPGAVDHAEEVVEADERHGRDHLRRRVHQHRPQGVAEVGPAHTDEPPVEPRLFAEPGDGVGTVADLVLAGHEPALGPERAATALHDDVVAARREEAEEDVRQRSRPLVRAAHDHRPERLAVRGVVIGQQVDAVAHPDRDRRRDGVAAAWGWQPEQPGRRRVDQALGTASAACRQTRTRGCLGSAHGLDPSRRPSLSRADRPPTETLGRRRRRSYPGRRRWWP